MRDALVYRSVKILLIYSLCLIYLAMVPTANVVGSHKFSSHCICKLLRGGDSRPRLAALAEPGQLAEARVGSCHCHGLDVVNAWL